MSNLVDDSSEFGTYPVGAVRDYFFYLSNILHRHGVGGRWLFKRIRWIERVVGRRQISDVERYGLRWRLYRHGNFSDARLLMWPDSFEPIEINRVLDAIQPDSTFVDIGSNIGFYALRVARKLSESDSGRVLAIEPHPDIRRRLEFNASLNPDCAVRILDCAVGDFSGMVGLLEKERNLGETKISEDATMKVPIKPLLEIFETEGIESMDVLKIDVEGFEDRVLMPFFADAPDQLLPTLLIAEDHWKRYWKSDWIETAISLGYRKECRTKLGNIILSRSDA